MKLRTSFLKRCLALVMALVLVVTCSNLGAVLKAFAADGTEPSVTVGEVVANNYELTEEEKDLLSSGHLAGGVITVPELGENLVSVDTENATITADKSGKWTPTTAYIIVDGETVETVELENGNGSYNPEVGNTFSVKVRYELTQEVDEDVQKTLLNAAAWLKQGIANTDAVSGQSGNLYILEQAMPELVNLAENDIAIGTSGMTVSLSDEGKAAIKTLNEQMRANDGKLDLSVMVAEYDAGSKTEYLMTHGTEMQDAVEDLVANLTVISSALTTVSNNVDTFVNFGFIDAATGDLVKTLSGVVSNLKSALATVAQDPWTAANMGTDLVAASAKYAKLDALVADLETVTEAPEEVKNPLLVAEKYVDINMNMFNVNVTVELKTVENKADSAALETVGTKTATVVVDEGATAEEIVAAVAENGVVADALAEWNAYVDGKFDVTATELPETLTGDFDYTITYTPKQYTVTYDYETDAPTSVPYGYQLTLPKHSDNDQSYDYEVNGEAYAQGRVYVVVGDTVVTRTSGKAYTSTDMYSVIADSFGDAIAKDILKSGALYGNEAINYRKPDFADAESLLKLENGMLTVEEEYSADYAGLYWVPYAYGSEGDLSNYFGDEYTKQWTDSSVKVQYILAFTNFGQEKAQEILDLAKQLKEEAAEQKSAMDSLAAMEDTLKMLDKTKLGALNGVIDVTDFTPGDGTDSDAENLALRAELKSVVSQIIANNVDSNNYLKIYNIVVNYKAEGLKYYYENYEEIKAEVNLLASYLTELMDNEDALRIMCSAAGYPEYADKISDVEGKLNDYNARLSAPNAAINVKSENLGKLVTALTAEGETSCIAIRSPYILSDVLTATDSSQVLIQVMIETPKGSATVTTDAMDRGTVVTKKIVDDLKAKVAAKVDELLKSNKVYYTFAADSDLDDLVDTELLANTNIYYTYSYTEYKVVIEGEEDQIVTIDDLEINLPKHPTAGMTYKYTVDGVSEITTSTYTFTAEQLDRLFVNGTYTITRDEVNEAEEKLEGTFADWIVKDQNGNIIGLNAEIDGNKDGIMDFAMKMVNSGYSYIGLNGEPLVYLNEENTLEICLQTMINAILNDSTFSSNTLIDLGKNGKGKLISASMQLGNSADEIFYEDLDFVLNLTSVPAQMATVSNGLTAVKNYMTFNSQDGVMNVNLNLPEKVYEVYLTALLATGNVDKSDINAINSEIAYQFLWDYVDLIINTEANATTYTNTLAKLGLSYDLTGYEDYYQMVKKVLTNDGVVINPETDGKFDMNVTAKGQSAINSLLSLAGMDISDEVYLGMVKEYKDSNADLTVGAVANLLNVSADYEAVILDLNASGVTNKFDYTTDLPARATTIADKAAVMLLGNVDGDLVFNGTTILDLNGFTVNGNIVANGTVYIIDSSLDSDDCGHVTGSVTGNAKIIAGNYDSNVSAYLATGYTQKGTAVINLLYTIQVAENGDITFEINSDVYKDVESYIPSVKTLAVDIAADLVLNYYTTAALSVDSDTLYAVDFEDIFTLLEGNNSQKLENVVNEVLSYIYVDTGITNFINNVIEDLLNFENIAEAINTQKPVASYAVATAPWKVSVSHVTNGNYITVGVTSNTDNEDLTKSYNLNLVFVGKTATTYLAPLAEELANIVTDETHITVALTQPTFDNKTLTEIGGTVDAVLAADLTSNNNYTTVIGVVLAYGNPAKAQAFADAINAGDMGALKEVFDSMSVKEVFDALKKLSRNVAFADMASQVGVTINTDDAADLETIYHLVLCGAGKVLEELDITGYTDKTMGALYNAETGYYTLSKLNVNRNGNVSYRGYTAEFDATVTELTLKVKIFGEIVEDDCLWGDADHDGIVDQHDASLVFQYYLDTLAEGEEICLKRTDVDGNGIIDQHDASLILEYYLAEIDKFPAEG